MLSNETTAQRLQHRGDLDVLREVHVLVEVVVRQRSRGQRRAAEEWLPYGSSLSGATDKNP